MLDACTGTISCQSLVFWGLRQTWSGHLTPAKISLRISFFPESNANQQFLLAGGWGGGVPVTKEVIFQAGKLNF